jgi:hypothetical protein
VGDYCGGPPVRANSPGNKVTVERNQWTTE